MPEASTGCRRDRAYVGEVSSWSVLFKCIIGPLELVAHTSLIAEACVFKQGNIAVGFGVVHFRIHRQAAAVLPDPAERGTQGSITAGIEEEHRVLAVIFCLLD